jgi:hypothetical protein
VRSPLHTALEKVPSNIREKLISSYEELRRNLAESRSDSAGLSAGKLCESSIRLLQWRVFGNHTPFGKKIPNFADECRRIIVSTSIQITESEKLVLPRALVFLYTMRNTRGIGHVGGDVDSNFVDAETMGSVADWIVCEFIRIHHGLSLEEAQDLVDSLAVRKMPDIWEVAGKRRVLRDGLSARQETLLLLYSTKYSAVLIEDIVEWVEYSNPSVFKINVLKKLHSERLIEWDQSTDTVVLSPKGALEVERDLLSVKLSSTDSKLVTSANKSRRRV